MSFKYVFVASKIADVVVRLITTKTISSMICGDSPQIQNRLYLNGEWINKVIQTSHLRIGLDFRFCLVFDTEAPRKISKAAEETTTVS